MVADGDAAETVAQDAKGVAESFVRILGLGDIILGALALYWVWLAFPGVGPRLPGTGYEFVDVALLGCAAALVGKVVSLAATLVMAIVWKVAARASGPSFPPTRTALAEYLDAIEPGTEHASALTAASWHAVLADAVAHAVGEAPRERAGLDRAMAGAEFTYGANLLLVLYVWQFARHANAIVIACGAAAVLVLFYAGTVQQRSYLERRRAVLVRARRAPRSRAASRALPAQHV